MRLNLKMCLGIAGLAFGLAWVCASPSVFAEEPVQPPRVDVTSFTYVSDSARPVAELCGRVTGVGASVMVKTVVDYNTSRPGYYNTLAGADGVFCTLVATYRGNAITSIEALGRTIESAPAKAVIFTGSR